MALLSLGNPIFAAFAVSAAIMVLKAVAMSWLTVIQMVRCNSGLRSPEDLRKTPFNPTPDPRQVLPDERVDRIRRIQQNDLENLPFYFMAGTLYVLSEPSLVLAQWLFYGYAASRILHFWAYLTAQNHEVRAFFWTIGSLITVYMAVISVDFHPEASR